MSDKHFNLRADHSPDRWDWCPTHKQWEQRGSWRSCSDQSAREIEMMAQDAPEPQAGDRT